MQSNPNLLPLNLAKLVEQVLVATVDESAQVRHALSLLIGYLVSNAPLEKLSAFSSLIVAHIGCGLTHIDERIQVDTLKTLGHFMKKPLIIVPHAHSVLPLLVKLIARKKVSSSSSGPSKSTFLGVIHGILSKQKGTFLSSNPDSKLADHSAKLQILEHLSKLLEAFLSLQKSNRSKDRVLEIGPTIDTVNKCVSIPNKTSESDLSLIDFSSPIPHIPIFRALGIYLQTEEPPHNESTAGSFSSTLISNCTWLQQILTLISELWVDCFSSYEESPTKDLKRSPLYSLLGVILQIIYSCLQIASISEDNLGGDSTSKLLTKFWSDFQAHFLSRFPLSPQMKLSSSNTILDLRICHITTKLLELIPNTQNKEEVFSNMASYLGSLPSTNISGVISTQEFQICVEILVKVYSSLVALNVLPNGSVCGLLTTVTRGVRAIFEACNPLSKSKLLLHECFGQLMKSTLHESVKYVATIENALFSIFKFGGSMHMYMCTCG